MFQVVVRPSVFAQETDIRLLKNMTFLMENETVLTIN